QQMAAVAARLLRGQRARLLPRLSGALPGVESAVHADNVRVPDVVQALGGECGTHAGRAIDNDRRVLVRDRGLDTHLEKTARDGDGVGNDALRGLVRLADVQHGGVVAVDQGPGVLNVDGADVLQDLVVNGAKAGHGDSSSGELAANGRRNVVLLSIAQS